MARKIKFALEMANGVKVRSNLDELRANFDVEKAVGYFLSGKLIEWLEDRYYDEEASLLKALDRDTPDFEKKLCEILGAEQTQSATLDVGALGRLNEKKAILRQKTDDVNIIANAAKTAFTQEDLAELLDLDEPIIYLCGKNFNIPTRVANKKYIGILGTPMVSVKTTSKTELDEKNIVFENVSFDDTHEKANKDAADKLLKQGQDELKSKNYSEALRLFQRASELGNSQAMAEIGALYYDGAGVEKDYSKALEYYSKAEKLGNAEAICNIGYLYANGLGVEQDSQKAYNYYIRAGELGEKVGYFNAGILCESGCGVPMNHLEALKCYKQSASMGYVAALRQIGLLYKTSYTFRGQYLEAYNWLKKASDKGDLDSMYQIGLLFDGGYVYKPIFGDQLVSANPDENDWQADWKKAYVWYKKAADLGHIESMMAVAEKHRCPTEFDNIDEAVPWWEKAADSGNTDAMVKLGDYYRESNEQEALRWYKKASDLGNVKGTENYGSLTRSIKAMQDHERDVQERFKRYAAPVYTADNIKEYLKQLQQENPQYNFLHAVYLWGENKKGDMKIAAATGAYANMEANEYPLLCLDTTFWGSGKEGLLATTNGIYINYRVKKFYRYAQLPEIELLQDDKKFYLSFDDKDNKIFTLLRGPESIALLELLNAFREKFS